MLLAATQSVEARCGAMEPRTTTAVVESHYDELYLPEWPVISVTSVDGVTVDPSVSLTFGRRWTPAKYTVEYRVGRDPVPDDLRLATLIIAAHLWETQRGPVGVTTQFTGVQGGTVVMPRGFALPNRALELMDPYMMSVIA